MGPRPGSHIDLGSPNTPSGLRYSRLLTGADQDNVRAWAHLAQSQGQEAQAVLPETVESIKGIMHPQAAFEIMKASAEVGLALFAKNLKEATSLIVGKFRRTVDAIEKAPKGRVRYSRIEGQEGPPSVSLLQPMATGAGAQSTSHSLPALGSARRSNPEVIAVHPRACVTPPSTTSVEPTT